MTADSRFPDVALCVACLFGTAMIGCASPSYTQSGALFGAGVGAGTGAIVGHQSGHGEAGAVLGGALGALGGALVGNAQDAYAQRDAALAELAASSRPLHPPLTNFDLIRMTQSGLGNEVIINAVQSRGGQFDLGPDGLIALKSNGVSETVIQYVQTSGAIPGPAQSPSTIVAPPPGVVIVQPRPVVDVHLGPPPVQIAFGHHGHYGHRAPPHRHRDGFALSWYHRF